jgi:hypothetical protein
MWPLPPCRCQLGRRQVRAPPRPKPSLNCPPTRRCVYDWQIEHARLPFLEDKALLTPEHITTLLNTQVGYAKAWTARSPMRPAPTLMSTDSADRPCRRPAVPAAGGGRRAAGGGRRAAGGGRRAAGGGRRAAGGGWRVASRCLRHQVLLPAASRGRFIPPALFSAQVASQPRLMQLRSPPSRALHPPFLPSGL